MKIGIFGGTFNPIHEGHLHLATHFFCELKLDKLLFVPTNLPPHKNAEDLADGVDRLNMCRLALRNRPGMEVSDIELRRKGTSRTIDTIHQLRETYPKAMFFLVLGSDMFLSFHEWRRWKEIIGQAALCVAARNEGEMERLHSQARYLKKEGARTVVADLPVIEISSTKLRKKLQESKKNIAYLPQSVKQYCETLNLYRDPPEEILGYEKTIRAMESPKRVYHSICVSKEAVTLALMYEGDPYKARIAGILHDIFKDLESSEMLQLVGESAIMQGNIVSKMPQIWHGLMGAQYLRQEMKIKDADILGAVAHHTTAKGGMTLLEKIIYLADFTSFDRGYPDIDIIRRKAERSLEEGMLYGLSYSIMKMVKEQKIIARDTIDAYNECLGAVKG